jgi:hypothetical protein
MGPLDLTLHFLNFVAPALWVAGITVLATRILMRKQSKVRVWWLQLAINSIAGMAVLGAGLVLFGRDGKMLTYAGMVLAMATTQWAVLKGWQR